MTDNTLLRHFWQVFLTDLYNAPDMPVRDIGYRQIDITESVEELLDEGFLEQRDDDRVRISRHGWLVTGCTEPEEITPL